MMPDGNISILELPDNWPSSDIFQLISAEVQISENELIILYNGKKIHSKNVSQLSLSNDDMISVSKSVAKRVQLHDIPNNITPGLNIYSNYFHVNWILDQLLALVQENPHLLIQFQNADSEMGNVLAQNDIKPLRMLMMQRQMNQHKVIFEKKQEENMIWSDPDNAENQRKIEERIKMENIQSSMETAIEVLHDDFILIIQSEVHFARKLQRPLDES